ncbi:MAG: hypothetical protein K9N05_05715 [Candidatus Marinimicrobia bacterium]|nr:hypothetical protein [Candidatus Neomarinimicrobiota bacterium]
MKRKLLIAMMIVLMLCTGLLFAHEEKLRFRPFQLSFGYPLGTNGLNAFQYTNGFSFNMLYGMNGGLDGVEIGSVFNYIHHNANGVQIAGVFNMVRQQSNGIFISGATNLHLSSVKGASISGALNLSAGHSDGLFIAGGTNIHLRTMDGVSIAGGLNITFGDAEGFTVAPVNLFFKEYSGVQIGVVNYVGALDGLQIGVVNYVGKDIDALPIGLISVVKDGYYELEFTSNELATLNASYKMGVEKFYNTFNVGYSKYQDRPIFRYGIGAGTSRPVGYKQSVSIEINSDQIINSWKWNTGLSLLSKLSLDYRLRLGEKFALVAGLSYNALVTSEKVDGEYGTIPIPKTVYEKEWTSSKMFMWFGFKAGFSYQI